MLGDQKQNVTEGSTAIQSNGDVHINHGLSPEQMCQILTEMSGLIHTLSRDARAETEARLKAFEHGILERFSGDSTVRSEAFRDPDFLAAVFDAQKAFARSGDDGLREVLTDLVAQRSKRSDRSRVSLTLNDAIVKVGSIPAADLNALSLMFFFKNTRHNGLDNIEQLADFLESVCLPLIDNISTNDSAANYLAAHNCIIPPGAGERTPAEGILTGTYAHIISKGLSEDTLRREFDDYDMLMDKGLIGESAYGNGLKIYLGGRVEWISTEFGVGGKYMERYRKIRRYSDATADELIEMMSVCLPQLPDIIDIYNHRNIRDSWLTSIGIALGHANLVYSPFKDSDLSIWIEP